MIERLAPLLIQLLNQFVVGFVFLFCLLISGEDTLPPAVPWLGAVTVWCVPNLVRLARHMGSEAQAPLVYKAVLRSIRAGYFAVLICVAAGFVIHYTYGGLPWGLAGFASYVAGNFAESRRLRRELEQVAAVDQ